MFFLTIRSTTLQDSQLRKNRCDSDMQTRDFSFTPLPLTIPLPFSTHTPPLPLNWCECFIAMQWNGTICFGQQGAPFNDCSALFYRGLQPLFYRLLDISRIPFWSPAFKRRFFTISRFFFKVDPTLIVYKWCVRFLK